MNSSDSSKPLVSAVITTHNRAHLLPRAINSVLQQTYQNMEIIVVDDNSQDDTPSVAKRYEGQIKYHRLQQDTGGVAVRTRMAGNALAGGEFVAFLDDDDQWFPTKIERQIDAFLQAPENCSVSTCGARIQSSVSKREKKPVINGDIRAGMLNHGLSTIPSCHLFKKSLFDQMGGYDLDLPAHNEHDIWMKMADRGYCAVAVRESLVLLIEDSRPRMMTDVGRRVEAFETFYNKWADKVCEWYGAKVGKKFLKQYMTQKMLGNARGIAQSGNRAGAMLMIHRSMRFFNISMVRKLFPTIAYLFLPCSAVKLLSKIKQSL